MGTLFFDEHAQPEATPPLPISDFEDFTGAELGEVLTAHYNSMASSGMCPLPTPVIKHIAGDGLEPLADLLNICVKANKPPSTWRKLKMVPLYKQKGAPTDPANYRGLAVGHPIAKLAMSAINQRLQQVADDGGLRAPTQAGFRPGYTVEELALVLSVSIQQANVKNTALGLLFVDLQKAYDSLSRQKVWDAFVGELGIPEHFV